MYQQLILDKIASTIQETAPRSDDELLELISGAGRVFLAGAGRSALVSRFFAMRLIHSGYQVSVVGEVATPSIQKGDLLITYRHFRFGWDQIAAAVYRHGQKTRGKGCGGVDERCVIDGGPCRRGGTDRSGQLV